MVSDPTGDDGELVKRRVKALARDRFGIAHTTLELERTSACCEGEDANVIGHPVDQPGHDHDGHHRHEHDAGIHHLRSTAGG